MNFFCRTICRSGLCHHPPHKNVFLGNWWYFKKRAVASPVLESPVPENAARLQGQMMTSPSLKYPFRGGSDATVTTLHL
jgi:hypothetical protein